MLRLHGSIVSIKASAKMFARLPIHEPSPMKAALSTRMRSTTNSVDIVDQKPSIVVVGSGWGGYRLAQELDKSKFDVKVISPRNHFVFTPLLPSTAVGTLEFRAIQEPVRTIKGVSYSQAYVDKINIAESTISCSDAFGRGHKFNLSYDAIVLAPGCETNTFNLPGVNNNPNVYFLKQLSHSRAIRNRLIDCFERASSPGMSMEEVKRLLTVVVVGGGPTSIEFAAELHDFLMKDVSRWYPDLREHTKLIVVEASGSILGSFDGGLVSYVESLFKSRRIVVMTQTAVQEVCGNIATLNTGSQIPFGLMVWSAGIKQVQFIRDIPSPNSIEAPANSVELVDKFPNGRLKVDRKLRVLRAEVKDGTQNNNNYNNKSSSDIHEEGEACFRNVFAIGDCAGDSVKPLPALAQVASQQAGYLAHTFNKEGLLGVQQRGAGQGAETGFKYVHLGAMASVGDWKGVYDSSHLLTDLDDEKPATVPPPPPVKGFLAFLLWRAAYLTKSVSIQNKLLIVMYWTKTMIFGRDISRF